MAGNRVISAVLTLRDRNFGTTATSAANSTRDLGRRVRSTGNTINRFGRSATSSFRNVAKSAVGLAAAYVGVSAIKDLGVSMIESAASAAAMGAQFDQIFGAMGKAAQTSVDKLASSFGMVSDRIKPGFTKITSMFKGFGMSTEKSMAAASDAMKLSADAAAFYDVAMTDSEGAITSFLKGNTNAAESIGIFATAAGMASFASTELGQNWKKLDEGGKQLVRLKYVEKMQAAAGATGQAARESDGLENVLGNLRQSWETLKAKFGVPILEPAVKGMQLLSSWLEKVDTDSIVGGFSKFGSVLKSVFKYAKPGLSWIKNNALPGVGKAVALLGIGVLALRDWAAGAFQNIKQRIEENKPALEAVKGVMQDLGEKAIELKGWMLNAFESAKPALTWLKDEGLPVVVDGIASVVEKAAEVYNYINDNWSLISPVVAGVVAAVLFYKTGMAAAAVVTYGMTAATTAMTIAQGAFNAALAISPLGWAAIAIGVLVVAGVALYKNWDKVKEVTQSMGIAISNTWSDIKTVAGKSLNFIIDKINQMIGVINKIPGVNIPIVAKVDWGNAEQPANATKAIKGTMDSYAVGTNRVKRDMVANIHKDEMIIPAAQSRNLRKQGVTIDNVDKPRTSSVSVQSNGGKSGGVTVIIENFNTAGLTAKEMVDEFVPMLKLRLANI